MRNFFSIWLTRATLIGYGETGAVLCRPSLRNREGLCGKRYGSVSHASCRSARAVLIRCRTSLHGSEAYAVLIATPTEASGVGALGATLLALARGRLSWRGLHGVVQQATKTTAYIFALFVGATAFSLVLRGFGGDELIEGVLTGLPFGKDGVVIIVLIAAFFLGFFLDWIEITLIILPLIAPVVSDLGVDLVWFTVMFAVCLQTSFITPPVGFALFYMKGVAPRGVDITTVYKGVIPFVFLQMIGVAAIFFLPKLVTWLPQVAYGN